MPSREVNFETDRFLVTGGAGFLGSYVCEKLVEQGVPPGNLIVPRRRNYDLTHETSVMRLYQETGRAL